MNKQCKVGVKYDHVRVDGKGLPCLRGTPPFDRGEELVCDKRRWPTEEEVLEMVEESERLMQRAFAGFAAVAADAEKRGLQKGNGGRGTVACPVCEGGTIHYSVSGYNGHRHAKCDTEDCIAFME
jgi:hypothetical protein